MSTDADGLSFKSREFYERAKAKVLFSICLGGAALAFLGFSSAAGGVSAGFSNLKEMPGLTNDQKEGMQAMVGGYGFAAFCHITAAAIAVSAAIYISPLILGTKFETSIMREPRDLPTF
jgi:hypothetical protein